MLQLSAKFRTKINWSNNLDLTYVRNNDWAFDSKKAYYNGQGTFNPLKYSTLRIGVEYKITFILGNNITDEYSGGVYIINNDNISDPFETIGKKEYIFVASDSLLTILPISSLDKLSITEFVIEELKYIDLDVFENEISLNKNISSIKDLEERGGTSSTEIMLPGTPKNNQFFKYIFNITSDNKFNINTKCKATIGVDYETIQEGYIQLIDINIDRDSCSYEVNFYNNTIDLFKNIGNTLLKDLNLTEFDHYASLVNVVGSWDNNNLLPYYYPYIQFGGEHYLDLWGGVVGSGRDGNGVGLTTADIYPGARVKNLIDHIFSANNCTYTSTIINSDNFKRLFIPFTNNLDKLQGWHMIAENYAGNEGIFYESVEEELSIEDPNQRVWKNHPYVNSYNTMLFHTEVPVIQNAYSGIFNNTSKNIDYYNYFNVTSHSYNNYANLIDYGATDIGNTWIAINPQANVCLNGCYRAFRDGKYKINTTVGLTDWSHIRGDEYSFLYKIVAFKINASCMNDFSNVGNNYLFEDSKIEVDYEIGEFRFDSGQHFCEAEFDCEKGDVIGFKMIVKDTQFVLFEGDVVGEITYEQLHLMTKYRIDNFKVYEYNYGPMSFVEFKNIVPQDMTVYDLMKSVMLMHNLLIEEDIDNPNNYIIETNKVFYSGGTVHDWSKKIDLTSIVLQTPTEFQEKFLKLKYEEGGDYFSDYYVERKDPNKVGYGGKLFEFENEFVNDENEISLNFSSTVMRTFKDFRPDFTMFTTYSQITKNDDNTTAALDLDTEWDPRILISNSIPTNYYNTGATYHFRFNEFLLHTWPYAGHVLDPFNMSASTNFDINFETPLKTNGVSQMMFETLPVKTTTNNNLYNLYWKEYLNNINNKDARILTANFNLSLEDIKKTSFRDKIFIDNTYYNLDSINEYVVGANYLTECVLIKVLNPTNTASESFQTDTSITLPFTINNSQEISLGVNNTLPPNSSTINLGSNNTTGINSLIIGNYNQAGNNSTILGGSGITSSNNSTLINSENVRVSIDGAIGIGVTNQTLSEKTIYIGDVKLEDGEFVSATSELYDCGLDCVQEPFSKPELNDSGENVLWDVTWEDSDISIIPE